jgi:sigma-B regulation protein RsbU (phosphoserine phosphatase)
LPGQDKLMAIRLIPKTRMGIFTAVLVVLWLLKHLLLTPALQGSLPAGPQFTLGILDLLLAVPVIYYTWRLFQLIRVRLLWKIRRRLILAHIFIGAIPVLLIIFITYVSLLLFYYQLTYYLISNQIGIHTAQVHAFNYSLRSTIQQALADYPDRPSEWRDALDRDSKFLLGAYPSASIILHVQNPGGGKGTTLGVGGVNRDRLDEYQVPRWLGDREFSRLVVEDVQPAIYRRTSAGAQDAGNRQLFIRSILFSDLRPEAPFSLEVSVPFDRHLLERLKAAIGQDLLMASDVGMSGPSVMLQNTGLLREHISAATFEPGSSGPTLDRFVWSIVLFPVSWDTGVEAGNERSQVLFVELSTSKLIQNVFRSETVVSSRILGVLQIVVGFFLFVEIASLIIGVMLTKSITSAVFTLYRGTEFVRRGDFSHRIIVRSDDQLGALARSFNQMTEYVQTLVKERVQKERLERELEIAKEVQEQLFPRSAPKMSGLELTGLCLPARVVSGDYYDFLKLDAHRIGLALGDICGKGISAALLMANLQASLRSNAFFLEREAVGAPHNHVQGPGAIAGLVRVLNEHICNHTSANKFASFFYAIYDDASLTLTYCNAGHNPPIYFSNGNCRRLTSGGTVVGIFPDADFEQETIHLRPSDIFLAYTDGIVESVNEYGEEFGEERLIDLIRANQQLSADDLQKIVVESVLDWAYEEERDDDMTLIVARIR